MDKIIIGIDPDSDKHGVAIYRDSKLIKLESLRLIDLIELLNKPCTADSIGLHIEDVCANNAAFIKKGVKNAAASTAINRSIGKCQQAQIELERIASHYGIKIVKHKISKIWKKDKAQFEKVTGWVGRSNEDTRSAAYFGWLGLKNSA